jgi:hypothetical protein
METVCRCSFFPDHSERVRLKVSAGQELISRKDSKEVKGVADGARILEKNIL